MLHSTVRLAQRFGAISAIERLINFDSAEHERFRFSKIVFNKVGSRQHAEASSHAGTVFAVRLFIQLQSVKEMSWYWFRKMHLTSRPVSEYSGLAHVTWRVRRSDLARGR